MWMIMSNWVSPYKDNFNFWDVQLISIESNNLHTAADSLANYSIEINWTSQQLNVSLNGLTHLLNVIHIVHDTHWCLKKLSCQWHQELCLREVEFFKKSFCMFSCDSRSFRKIYKTFFYLHIKGNDKFSWSIPVQLF